MREIVPAPSLYTAPRRKPALSIQDLSRSPDLPASKRTY